MNTVRKNLQMVANFLGSNTYLNHNGEYYWASFLKPIDEKQIVLIIKPN